MEGRFLILATIYCALNSIMISFNYVVGSCFEWCSSWNLLIWSHQSLKLTENIYSYFCCWTLVYIIAFSLGTKIKFWVPDFWLSIAKPLSSLFTYILSSCEFETVCITLFWLLALDLILFVPWNMKRYLVQKSLIHRALKSPYFTLSGLSIVEKSFHIHNFLGLLLCYIVKKKFLLVPSLIWIPLITLIFLFVPRLESVFAS